MLSLSHHTKVYLAREPIDMRRQIDGLALEVQEVLALDPMSAHVFVFRNRNADRLKGLFWDANGFLMFYKRIERGRFQWPSMDSPCVQLGARARLVAWGTRPAEFATAQKRWLDWREFRLQFASKVASQIATEADWFSRHSRFDPLRCCTTSACWVSLGLDPSPEACAVTFQTLRYELAENVATITLNRPQKLNAVDSLMIDELIAAADRVDADDAVRAVIVTGAGRAFCAGADLSGGARTFDRSAQGETGPHAGRDGGGRVTLRIFDSTKPWIGAINGPAVGFGMTLQLAFDLRLASESARFGMVFTRRAVVMEACSSWFLTRAVGMAQAQEWVLTGRVFDAAEALQGGLVRSVHAAHELMPAARALAREIAANTGAVSVAYNRNLLWKMAGADHPMEAHKLDSRGMRALGAMSDAREGVASFLEKREPRFTDSAATQMPESYPWWDERAFE